MNLKCHVSKPFYLLKTVYSLGGGDEDLSIDDLIYGDVTKVILMNYCVDILWMLKSCPILKVLFYIKLYKNDVSKERRY